MRVLFACHSADGHFLPLVPLARAFSARGDEVAFAAARSTPTASSRRAFRPSCRHRSGRARRQVRPVSRPARASAFRRPPPVRVRVAVRPPLRAREGGRDADGRRRVEAGPHRPRIRRPRCPDRRGVARRAVRTSQLWADDSAGGPRARCARDRAAVAGRGARAGAARWRVPGRLRRHLPAEHPAGEAAAGCRGRATAALTEAADGRPAGVDRRAARAAERLRHAWDGRQRDRDVPRGPGCARRRSIATSSRRSAGTTIRRSSHRFPPTRPSSATSRRRRSFPIAPMQSDTADPGRRSAHSRMGCPCSFCLRRPTSSSTPTRAKPSASHASSGPTVWPSDVVRSEFLTLLSEPSYRVAAAAISDEIAAMPTARRRRAAAH